MTVMLLQHTPFTRQKFLPACTKTCASECVSSPRRMTTTDKRQDSLQISCDNKAMRYYRLWIYTCNTVLFLSVVAFAIVAGKIVVCDVRRYFVPGLNLYQPTFLYCYLALITQCGVLQLIGCLGALRLNERLLNTYWTLLLVLLCGDIIVGLVWIFRFDKIVEEVKPSLKQRLASEYGTDTEFTAVWDALQRDFKCCGVQGVQDFAQYNKTMASAVLNSNSEWLGTPTPPTVSAQTVPESCCKYTPGVLEKKPLVHAALRSLQQFASPSSSSENQSLSHVIIASQPERPDSTIRTTLPEPCGEGMSYNTIGCEAILTGWLNRSAEVLVVLGFCVIAFLKLCFVGILKYEITEMIQKIKVLHGEMRTPQLLLTEMDAGAPTVVNSPTTQHLQPLLSNHRDANSGAVVTESNGGIPVAARESSAGPVLPLLQTGDSVQTTPLHSSSATAHHRHLSLLNDGTDSDTNSNSALIIADDSGKCPRGNKQNRNSNGNNNSYELHELHELNRLLARHQTQI